MKIAVVHNGNHTGIIARFGRPCPERYSLRHVNLVADSLRGVGHTVEVLEADTRLFDQLRAFATTDGPLFAHIANDRAGGDLGATASNHLPTAMVFNMAYGIQGDARYTHLPGMLELAGIPYTGSSPLGHALALDKVITKILMLDAGVPTPAYRVLGDTPHPLAATSGVEDLRYPLIVKPRHESTSYGLRLVHDEAELDAAVSAIVQTYQQTALVEEYIDGREVCIGILGNDPVEFLPPVELDFGDRGLRLMTWDDKYHKRMDEPRKVCPAPLSDDTAQHLNRLALATFRACHLRDYARVDIRIDPQGRPFVLEVNSMASLGDGGSYVTAAKAAGYTFATLANRIVEVAYERHRDMAIRTPVPAKPPTLPATDLTPIAVVSGTPVTAA
jgi:D-alanine-D-alanine ligase